MARPAIQRFGTALSLVLIFTSCAADERADSELAQVPGGGIGVFDGVWILSDIDGLDEDDSLRASFEELDLDNLFIRLDVEDPTSTIVVGTNCRKRSGSYTFTSNDSNSQFTADSQSDSDSQSTADSQSGEASISLPGSTKKDCDQGSEDLEQFASLALESVTGWARFGDRLELTATLDPDADVNPGATVDSPSASTITLMLNREYS